MGEPGRFKGTAAGKLAALPPEGDGYNIVVQFKQTANAKPAELPFQVGHEYLRRVRQRESRKACRHRSNQIQANQTSERV